MNKTYLYIGIAAIVVLTGATLFFQYRAPFVVQSAYVSSDIAGLPEAKPTEIIELKGGDTYDFTAGFVKKTIGNRSYRMLAYNGSIPGPMIKTTRGAEVTINFRNDTDIETTIHSHGVRLDNQFDGTPPLTQKAVQPGETFVYKIKFPDVGMYWYHPHVREDYVQELGLYGNYLVSPDAPGYWNEVNREVPLFLDDILIENGSINLSKNEAGRTLMGRFGNVMLINGEPEYRLEAKKGELIRFYVTNAANTRTFNFAIPNATMKLVGGDGGATEREGWKDAVLLGPSERAVVEVLFDRPGMYAMENKTPQKSTLLGTIAVLNNPATPSFAGSFATLRTNAAAVTSIDPYRAYFNKPIDKRLTMTIDMMPARQSVGDGEGGMMSSGSGMDHSNMMQGGTMSAPDGSTALTTGGIEWEDSNAMMNQMSTKEMTKWKIVDEDTGKANMDIDWKFKVGDVVKIRITNDANSAHPMQHPVHFHGQQFLVLNQNGKLNTNLVWKDTVLVPAGQYMDILLNVTNPGAWMAHCHIAEHLTAGMMFSFKVE